MSRRHVSKIKRGKTKDIGVAILAYESGKKSRSHTPKYLLNTASGDIFLEEQIRIVTKTFFKNSVYVATGVECDKISEVLPRHVRIVENQNFHNTGPAEYFRLLINNSTEISLLFIDGDLTFSEDDLFDLDFSRSFVVCAEEACKPQEIGATISDGEIAQLSFGLKNKIHYMFFLKGEELKLAQKICKNRDKNKLLIFEILNFVINNGGELHPYILNKASQIKKIESVKDLYENTHIQ
jgi:hypothetical protein